MTETLAQAQPAELRDDALVPLRRELARQFAVCQLARPFRRARYDPGERLELSVTGVVPAASARVTAEIEQFVGGGFAGQVYRVSLLEIEPREGTIDGLQVGQTYATKILKPPSTLARCFRDLLYFLGYQGAFSAQVNPAAARVGALWQKLIRRAAARRLGTENAVCNTYATFYDERLRSFGEINEWVAGRVWKFEVDDQLFDRWKFDGPPPPGINSPEYVHKKLFMRELVGLLHEMGAPELARQYEWWTCKSQPNVLKRTDTDASARDGLTAIDFRAGLTLLPFLPMSPADLWLILRGVARGRLVQFDHADLGHFERFIAEHPNDFEDLQPAITELKRQETLYRRSLLDVTHHHVRLVTDGGLRESVRQGAIVAWRNLGRIDEEHADRLSGKPWLFALLFTVSLVPLLGRWALKLWGERGYRTHVRRSVTSWDYLCRAMRGARIETIIRWHRGGRVSDERAVRLVARPIRYWVQRILVGWLPASWHRFLTEPRYAWSRIGAKTRFVYQFLRHPPFREEWLLEQVRRGRAEGMLTDAEADRIAVQIKDPYIQKYLKSVAVHLCTLPVTQVVSVIVALYVMVRFGTSWTESLAYALGVLAFFQVTPISPGSIVRGSYVVYLIATERNARNYWVAALISFWKYVGYLGFPIQMVRQYPALARYMGGRWATGAVRFLPVFGERGSLPEHAVFDLFFNLPLSVRRRFREDPFGSSLRAVLLAAMLALLIYNALVLVFLGQAWLAG
jgi:hypothetical protein